MKNHFLFFAITAICSIHLSMAQVTFQKTFYANPATNMAHCVHQTADGGYIVSGMYNDLGPFLANAILIKTNEYGDTLWTKLGVGGIVVVPTSDGGYIMNAMSDLTKTDSAGNIIWVKNFIAHNYVMTSIHEAPDGGYFASGTAHINFNNDFYLTKTDSIGNLIWAKHYGGPFNDQCNSMQPTLDGGFILAGITISFGAGNHDIYLVKTDSIGNLMWSKTFGSSGDESGNYVLATSDSGYIVLAGGYLIKTDSNGDSLWTRTFGIQNDAFGGYGIHKTFDGGYILTGGSDLSTNPGAVSSLLKIDSLGGFEWLKQYGDYYFGFNVEQTADSGYVFTGVTHSPEQGVFIKTDSFGNIGCNETSGVITILNSSPLQVLTPPTQAANDTTLSLTLIMSPTDTLRINTICSSVGLEEVKTGNAFTVFPNPTSGKFVVSFEKAVEFAHVQVMDIFGKLIFEESIFNESELSIELKNLREGIYLVRINEQESSFYKKILIAY